ncbi:MAG: hypothetical protein VW867_06080 [Gammaproteobacteria bacterium]|jgi:hypothetical protein
MAGLTRSNLLKVKRFKESKADFEQQVGRASWFYLAWAILMLGALLMEGSILSRAILVVVALAALAPTIKPRAVSRFVTVIDRNHDLWMKQNKIAYYSKKTAAFLYDDGKDSETYRFHDPVCEECWHEEDALFNLDENRTLYESDGTAVGRLKRQPVSQLDLMDFYWKRMSLRTALTLYVSFGDRGLKNAATAIGD